MTDKDVVFRKLSSLREHVSRMRRRRSDDIATFRAFPASYAESFGMLASHGVIDTALAAGLSNMAALRNRLAHRYGTAGSLDRAT